MGEILFLLSLLIFAIIMIVIGFKCKKKEKQISVNNTVPSLEQSKKNIESTPLISYHSIIDKNINETLVLEEDGLNIYKLTYRNVKADFTNSDKYVKNLRYIEIEISNYKKIKKNSYLIFDEGEKFITGKADSNDFYISYKEKYLVSWNITMTCKDLRSLEDNTLIATIYVGEENCSAYIEQLEYEKARKRVLNRQRRKELDKIAYKDLKEEGIIKDYSGDAIEDFINMKDKYDM